LRFSGKPLPLQFREEVSKQGNSNTYNTPFPTEFTPDRRAFTQDKIMDGILSFILFLIIGFYVAGLIGRVLLRRWIMRKQKEFEQGGNPFFRTYTWSSGSQTRNDSQPKPEGKITVEQTRVTEKRVSGEVGDYVDYEEIKESK
jgi:hypothetical protein